MWWGQYNRPYNPELFHTLFNRVKGFLQGRDPDWVHRPFFAHYDENATWLNEVKPAFGEKRFFFEDALEHNYRENIDTSTIDDYE